MKIKSSDLVVLDFETFYSKTYSLSLKTYNTSSYIRDPQFYAQMLGVKDGTKKTVWYRHEDIGEALIKHRVAERPTMAHNMPFDGFIMSDRYDCIPGFLLCTLSMARGLHGTLSRNDLDTVSKLYGRGGKVKPHALKKVKGIRILSEHPELEKLLAQYMTGDVDECYAIGKMQLAVYPQDELELIDWTIRQFVDPVLRLDKKLVQEELDDEISGKAAKRRQALLLASFDGVLSSIDDKLTPDEKFQRMLQSNDKLAAALESLGVDPPMKVNKDGDLTYAFAKNDLDFQALLEHDDDRVVALVEARLATKSTIGETRARRMLEFAGRPMPVAYNYCGAHTTRWSGGNKCLVGETLITVLRDGQVLEIQLSSLSETDLVWDGVEFVQHDGLIYQGEADVMTYDGVTGTEDHEVYCEGEEEPIQLVEAARRGLRLQRAPRLESTTKTMSSSEGPMHEPT